VGISILPRASYNARHHQWAGKTGFCKWQVNMKNCKKLKPHDPAHLSEWRCYAKIFILIWKLSLKIRQD
jgi:hypothetical protein